MSVYQIESAVVFIIFNRPDTTRKVFEQIKIARPRKLFLIADGPRFDKFNEAEVCKETRSIVGNIDWECEVFKNFSEINLGCKIRVSSGIDWVFKHVEDAIILEDDIFPDLSFFQFCDELLRYYRNDKRIAMISGDNFQFGSKRNHDSYYFSKFNHIWGWATWKDRWVDSYDVKMKLWPTIRNEGWIYDILPTKKEARYWQNAFENIYNEKIDTWDYQWTFACWCEGRLTILPNENLITNIGFRSDATHTTQDSIFSNMPLTKMCFPLKHPAGIICNNQYDKKTTRIMFNSTIYNKILNKFRQLFK